MIDNSNTYLHDIEKYLDNCIELPREADWLQSSFSSSSWICKFEAGTTYLNWNISLYNGSCLLDPKNERLLTTLKCWIIAATQKISVLNSKSSGVYGFFSLTGHIVNYILLNGERFKIARHGLKYIFKSEIYYLIDRVTTLRMLESLYDFDTRLKSYIEDLRINTDKFYVTRVIQEMEDIHELDDKQSLLLNEQKLPYDKNYLVEARALLVVNNCYLQYQTEKKYRKVINIKSICEQIFANCIKLPLSRHSALVKLLSFNPKPNYSKEFPAAPVTLKSNRPFITVDSYGTLCSSLASLGELREYSLPAPPKSSFDILKSYSPILHPRGRFRTLPSEVTFFAVRKAIEFHCQYGEAIIQSFKNLVSYGLEKIPELSTSQFVEIISPTLVGIGVKNWSLLRYKGGRRHYAPTKKLQEEFYFTKFRSNEGYRELLRVYVGCCQVVVGILMARRKSELCDLKSSKALDSKGKYLLFNNRKSGIGSLNMLEARPIDELAVEMIRLLQCMHESNTTTKDVALFSIPSLHSPSTFIIDNAIHNQNLDLFCDYFEIPLDSKNRRYYMRQHQFRRFFALLFFHGHSMGKLETLQWFLGHSDPAHLYNYISHDIPGTVLNGVKASFVAENFVEHKNAYKSLTAFVESRYETKDFTVCDIDELELIISDLIDTGEVTVLPEFFTTEKGERYKIVVKIVPTNQSIEVGE